MIAGDSVNCECPNIQIVHRIAEIEQRLETLDAERAQLASELDVLRDQLEREKASAPEFPNAPITNSSPSKAKIELIRKLFRGRDDVYARR